MYSQTDVDLYDLNLTHWIKFRYNNEIWRKEEITDDAIELRFIYKLMIGNPYNNY